jgi:maleate isomerase
VSAQAVAISPRLDPVRSGVGVVAPFDLALDRELWRWTPEHVSLYLTRTPHVDEPVSVAMAEALRDLTEIERACRAVSVPEPGATVYLCTSASFVDGLAGEARLREAMERAGARRAITTSGALLEALRALAVRRVAVGTPYDADLTARLGDFLAEAGYETVGAARMDLGADIWRVSADSVRELVHAMPRAGADAIFLSCTNLPTYDVIADLEQELDVPVLSANLVTMWAALHAIGALPGDRPERLFRDAR